MVHFRKSHIKNFFLLWFTSEKLKDFGFRSDVRIFVRIHIFGLSAVRPFRSREIKSSMFDWKRSFFFFHSRSLAAPLAA